MESGSASATCDPEAQPGTTRMPSVPRRRSGPPIRAIRRALLAAMVLLVVAVVALFVLGRSSQPAPIVKPSTTAGGEKARSGKGKRDGEHEAAVLSEGFDYEQQVAGKPVFRLKGKRFTTDRQGKIALSGVQLELYRDGEPYHVASRRANYDPDTHDAQLIGDVHLTGGVGWNVDADRLDLVGGGRIVVSRGRRVHFRRVESFTGAADHLRFDLKDDRLHLNGKVHLETGDSPDRTKSFLDAGQATWEKDARTIDAQGRVQLHWGDNILRGHQVHAILRDDQGDIESASASGEVTGALRGADGGQATFAGRSLEAAFDDSVDEPTRIRLHGESNKDPASVRFETSEAPVKTISAPEIELDFAAGKPSEARASGGVLLEERAPDHPARVIRGDRLVAAIGTARTLESAQIEGSVVLQDGDITAGGQLAVLARGGEHLQLTGSPARARNASDDEMTAPRIEYDRKSGEVTGTGGVLATFKPESSPLPDASSSSSAPREPVHVQSDSATFILQPRGYLFVGGVQAAQGASLLFADRLEGDEVAGRATATGKVRTIWKDAESAGDGGNNLTVATGDKLVYGRESGKLRYSGNVRVKQQSRELAAQEVEVLLDSERRAQRMLATGEVRLQDKTTGRIVTGDDADYELDKKSVIVTGTPVTIRDLNGSLLKGRRALFDVATGSAKILSEDS